MLIRSTIVVFALLVCLGVAIMPVAALAQSVNSIANTAKAKVADITTIVTVVGGGLIGVGVAAGGIMMAMGRPDAWEYMGKVVIGGILIAAASQIAKWISS